MFNKLNTINNTRLLNDEVLSLYSSYLINHPCNIKRKEVNDFLMRFNLGKEKTFQILFTAELGLSEEDSYKDEKIVNNYIRDYIKMMSLNDYESNSYYQNIKFDTKTDGKWELTYESYAPYETFVYDDIEYTNKYEEIPKIGFFNCTFKYPVVKENNNVWMSITPNEINTMKKSIDCAHGDVITFGLGLGYYAYMVSLKDNVKSVAIIEKDASIIKLFKENILPQFKYKDKVKIICEDAFDYLEKSFKYDYAFVDLWHDVSDGFELYLKFKSKEKNICNNVDYWIEDSLLSVLRRYVWEYIHEKFKLDKKSTLFYLDGIGTSEPEYKKIYTKISCILDKENISTIDDINFVMSLDYLKDLAGKIDE